MKLRTGFVSNSSSASFVASMHVLTAGEYIAIKNYMADQEQNVDGWSCHVDEGAGLLTGYTGMDNSAFSEWLEKQGINKVRFGE